MPIYEYRCLTCGKKSELLQRMSDPPMAACPECGGEVKKLISSPAVQFKGSGWYVTDYGSKKGGAPGGGEKSGESGKSEGSGSSDGGGKSEGGGEGKTADKSASSSSSSSSSSESSSGGSGSGGETKAAKPSSE